MDTLNLRDLLSTFLRRDGETTGLFEAPHSGPGRGYFVDTVGEELPQDRNLWFALNPGADAGKGRVTIATVTRIAALHADLDIGTGARCMPDAPAARRVVDTLSRMLGTSPVAVILSGHGFQPIWAIDLEETLSGEAGTDLLRRWGRLVRHVAQNEGGDVDSVFEAARLVRAPGSVNWKDPAAPVAAVAVASSGRPLTIVEIEAALEANPVPVAAPTAPGAPSGFDTPRFDLPEVIRAGERYSVLFRYATSMRARGVRLEEAKVLFAAAVARCESPETFGREPSYILADVWERYEDTWKPRVDDSSLFSDPALQAASAGAPAAPVVDKASLFADTALLLSGDLPEPPVPGLLECSDGIGLFYEGKYNVVYGDPESGKTWVALSAVVETVKARGLAVVVDMDHNGHAETVARLLQLGATPEELSKPDLFLYTAPEDGYMLDAVVETLREMKPTLVTLDSIGEIVAAYGKNSNLDDDFTFVHQRVMKRLVYTGAAVVAIDHLAKGEESRSKGASGAAAKKRVIDGTYIRCVVTQQFAPGRGGRATLVLSKDRNGGLRKARGAGVGDVGVASFWLHPVEGWVLDAASSTVEDDELEDKIDSAPIRIMNFLLENPGQRFTAEQIGREAVQMRGQQIKAAVKTARNALTILARDEKIKKGHKPDSQRTLVFWVDEPVS